MQISTVSVHQLRSMTTIPYLSLGFALLVFFTAVPAMAQPRNTQQKIGPTVVDQESPHYRFEKLVVSSPDGKRTWRVQVGIPKSTPPTEGFPSLWMLDGNAALSEFNASILEDLSKQSVPQVLVFLGYDNDLRIDSPARTRDYTPQLTRAEESDAPSEELTGGAQAFLEVIERKIRPQVAELVPLNPKQQTLWGHSFGGLFTLHTLFTRAGAFQTYASSSPSLWWGKGYGLKEAEQFMAHNAGQPARVLIFLGGGERVGDYGPRDLKDPRVAAHMARVTAVPSDSAFQLSEQLKTVHGLNVSYHEFPGLGHGPMLRASLMATLHTVAGIPDRNPPVAKP